MVFHGDYEVEFEIYENAEGDWRARLLGHMVGVSPSDAKTRWLEAHTTLPDQAQRIQAVYPYEEWK